MSVISLLGIVVVSMIIAPAYADQVVKPSSGGTLNIGFETNPSTPTPGDQTELKISFINKQTNTLQPHVDYKVSVTQGDNKVFGIPVTHVGADPTSSQGLLVTIPVQFQIDGTYQVTVEVQTILFQPIPPETATFTVVVGQPVPEFGPMAGIVIAISTISVIILSKKTQLHI